MSEVHTYKKGEMFMWWEDDYDYRQTYGPYIPLRDFTFEEAWAMYDQAYPAREVESIHERTAKRLSEDQRTVTEYEYKERRTHRIREGNFLDWFTAESGLVGEASVHHLGQPNWYDGDLISREEIPDTRTNERTREATPWDIPMGTAAVV